MCKPANTTASEPACERHFEAAYRLTLDIASPLVVIPQQLESRRALSLSWLRQIEHVQVTACERRRTWTLYRIEVFKHNGSSNIPVHSTATQSVKRMASGTVIQHTFQEFLRLRRSLFAHARESHNVYPCQFCRQIMHLNGLSGMRPSWSTTWSKTQDQVCHQLSVFLQELVAICCHLSLCGNGYTCNGQELVPPTLQSFLTWSSEAC